MLHQKDRQKRLPFFYRNNIQKRGGIVPNIVPHIIPNIVPIELQKPLFCGAVGKEKAFRKKAACAVNAVQAAFLPSGEFAEVVDKSRL